MRMQPSNIRHLIRKAGLFGLSWPYYRALYHRTITPTEKLLKSRSFDELCENTVHWVDVKNRELHDVNIAATVCIAITVGIFSWPNIARASWYTRGLWYSDFILAILALIAAGQENILLDEMLTHKRIANSGHKCQKHIAMTSTELKHTVSHVLKFKELHPSKQCGKDQGPDNEWEGDLREWLENCRPNNIMLFIWQAPLMLMSWAWVIFVTGLTLHVMQPWIEWGSWGDDSLIAIMFLSFLGPGLILFVFSAYFPYIRSGSETACDVGELKDTQSTASRLSSSTHWQKQGLSVANMPSHSVSRTSSAPLSHMSAAERSMAARQSV